MKALLTEGLRTIKKAAGAKAKDAIAAAGSPFRDHHQVIPLSPQPQWNPAISGIFYCPKSDESSAYRRTEDNKKSSRSESEGCHCGCWIPLPGSPPGNPSLSAAAMESRDKRDFLLSEVR